MRREARREESDRPAEAGFDHSSRHIDLKALVDDHMLDTAAAEKTSKWFPSRRGNSPRGS